MNLFITSDKQGSGKTFIAAGLAATMQSLGYSVGYYKPVQTAANNRNGFIASQDVAFIKKIDPNLHALTSYVFQTDAMPMLAAEAEKIKIQPEVIVTDYLKLRKISEIVLVESCGGILTPYTQQMRAADFVLAMKTPMLMVVEPTNNVFENVIANIKTAQHMGIKVKGIILNKFIKSPHINVKKLPVLLEAYSGVPIVGIVGYKTNSSPSGLIDTILHSVDLETIFDMKIPKLDVNFEH